MGNDLNEEIDVEVLMERIREEVVSRTAPSPKAAEPPPQTPISQTHAKPMHVAPHFSREATPPPRHIALDLPDAGEQIDPAEGGATLSSNDLLALDDDAFVQTAYMKILKRPADAGGLKSCLERLKNNESKLDVLASLRYSQEGKKVNVAIEGLPSRSSLRPVSHFSAKDQDDRCHIDDFLPSQGRAFIELAYKKILRRPPDVDGLERYVNFLGSGASKIEILGILRYSSEGKLAGVSVDGLAAPYALLRLYRVPIVGRFFEIIAAIWNLPKVVRTQRILESRLFALVNQTQSELQERQLVTFRALRELEKGYRELAAYAAPISDHQALEQVIEAVCETAKNKVDKDELQRALVELRTSTQVLQASKAERHELTVLTNRVTRLDAAQTEIKTTLHAALAAVKQSVAKLLETKAEHHEITALTNHVAGIAQGQLTREDVRHIEETVSALKDALALIGESKVDRVALDAAQAEIKTALQDALATVNQSLHTLSENKADQSVVDLAQAETKSEMRTTLDGVKQTVATLLETKVEHHEITALTNHVAGIAQGQLTREDVRHIEETVSALKDALALIGESKVDRVALDAAQTEIETTLQDALATVKQSVHTLSQNKADQSTVDVVHAESQAALRNTVLPIVSQAHDLKRALLDQERRLGLLLEEARKRLPAPISTKQIEAMLAEEDHLLDAMYASFEDRFRGTRADIKQRQSIYVPYIRDAKAGNIKAPIIDLGCGRGEWLELLRDEGLTARGVDLNRIFLEGCREIDLDVTEQDVVAYLRGLKANSVGAVTSFHLIEHIPLKIMIALFDETLRVLKPGGVAIFETPNPKNLIVGSCTFYLDPTHRNPLPPELPAYLLEARGFVDIRVLELHPFGEEEQVTGGTPQVNETLNRYLFGPRDYSVICRKA